MWRVFGQILDSRASIVIRIGGAGLDPEQIARGLETTAFFSKRAVRRVEKPEVTEIKHRQTNSFRPGSRGCRFEIDCVFQMI
jgi:hypothetical protein